MTLLRLAFILAFFMILPSNALGADFGSLEDHAYEQAITYWGKEPMACGSLVKNVELLPPNQAGKATQPSPSTLAGSAACSITISTTTTANPALLCVVMIHEVGHLIGLSHSDDPTNVMYPTVISPSLVAPCALEPSPPVESLSQFIEQLNAGLIRGRRKHCLSLHSPQKRTYCWSHLKVSL